jgi:hypothetical protein
MPVRDLERSNETDEANGKNGKNDKKVPVNHSNK